MTSGIVHGGLSCLPCQFLDRRVGGQSFCTVPECAQPLVECFRISIRQSVDLVSNSSFSVDGGEVLGRDVGVGFDDCVVVGVGLDVDGGGGGDEHADWSEGLHGVKCVFFNLF